MDNEKTVPEYVNSQNTKIDTDNTVNNSSDEFSSKDNEEREDKGGKKKVRAENNENDNDQGSDKKSLENISNNNSSETMETDDTKATTTNGTTLSNTWAAIDTLDDVRQLAQETTTESDNFDETQENELNKMRRNQIKLLQLMIERNTRLQKVEISNSSSSSNSNTSTDDTSIVFTRDSDKHNSNNNHDDVDKNGILENDPITNPIRESTIKQGKREKEGQTKEYPPPPCSSSNTCNPKSIYVSDYLEKLDNVQTITTKESEYIDAMERIINTMG